MAVIERDLPDSPTRRYERPSTRTIGRLQIDPYLREVRVDGDPVRLTRKEYQLLDALAAEPTRLFTREELYLLVWGYESSRTRTLDSHAHRLRNKLAPAGEFVINVWGVGYRLTDRLVHQAGQSRFLITETSQYLVRAESAENAEAIYLEHGENGPGVNFLSVAERTVQEADR